MATAVKRRSVQRLAGRKRPSYYESDEDEFDIRGDADYSERRASSPKRRSARQVAARQAYEDPPTDEEVPAVEEEIVFEELPTPQRRRARTTKPATRSATNSRRTTPKRPVREKKPKSKPSRRFGLGPPRKWRGDKPAHMGFRGPSDGRIPAWTTLPIAILRDIFLYAAAPMNEQTPTAAANVKWLMRAARTCRAFALPALEAYYQSPPFLSHLEPHYLLELLKIPKEKTFIDYHVKVKDLEVDVRRLSHTLHGKAFDLSELIRELPRLQHLQITYPTDEPPYRSFFKNRWTYPLDLFDAMNATGAQFKEWRWNRNLVPGALLHDFYAQMTQIHQSKAFEYVDSLVVCDFNIANNPDSLSSDPAAVEPPDLASAISVLPRLKDLTFISCDVIMDKFLERLPINLHRLDLSNCLEIYDGMLERYLTTGGSELRELVLDHNPALSLAFLPRLKTLCPRLEALNMDMMYYSERSFSNDAVAMYDELLTAHDIPTWPSKLNHLELTNLQRLSPEAAQNLFRSLVDSARDLPDLRHLVILAHINIPWRDRAGFRDQWIERLQRVFLRRAQPPNPSYGSLKQMRIMNEGQSARSGASEGGAPSRHALSHVSIPRSSDTAAAPLYPDIPEPRRSTRVVEGNSSAADDVHSASDSSGGDEDGPAWRSQPEAFVQGLCDVVDIRIDNQRPREKQWTEGEFLDTEASGDEDWQEGADADDQDDRYAW